MDEDTLLNMDYRDLSDSDLAVMFTIGDGPVLNTRLQKITLLFEEMYGILKPEAMHSAYFFGGYSDEIDESATGLTSAGIIDETSRGYVLTDYGRRLREYAERCIDNEGDETGMTVIGGIRNIVRSLNGIPDRNVVGLTYQYYQDTAVRPEIKESVDLLNEKAVYNGKRLDDIDKDEFEDILRRGEGLHLG